jgi:hypothetical protein
MSIGNLKDSGNQGNNFPWQLKVLQGLQCTCDGINNAKIVLDTIITELEDQTALLQAIENNTDGVEGLLTTIRNTLNTALTGSFTPNAILANSLSFPYTAPAGTFKGFTLIIPTGETIQFNGVTLPGGTYNFSGEGSQTSVAFTLDNPSGTGVVILTVQ